MVSGVKICSLSSFGLLGGEVGGGGGGCIIVHHRCGVKICSLSSLFLFLFFMVCVSLVTETTDYTSLSLAAQSFNVD